jgi:PAS domain-containing protein
MKIKDLPIYEAILQESDIIFALMDMNLNYIDMHPVFDGYQDSIGTSVFNHVTPENYKLVQEKFNLAKSGKTCSFEIDSLSETGNVDWWQNTNIPIFIDGKVSYILSLAKNISNQKKFKEDDSLLESLLSSSPDYIALIDEEYRYIYVNKIQNAFRGTRFEGTYLKDFLGEKYFLGLKEYMDRAKREKVVVNRRATIKDPEGRTLYY